jgi:lactate dehydrogenase-like 2-hydroxyacid dehydrogenase
VSLPKVFVTRPLPAPVLARLAARCEMTVHPEDEPMQPAQLADACRLVEGLMVSGGRVSEEVLAHASRLRAVATVGVGYDNIDVAACTRRRILVTNTPGVVTESTADLAFALLLAVARRVVENDRYIREGHWTRWQWGMQWGGDVHGKTLGLYGFGRIGQAMARRAGGFSMRILYTAIDRPTPELERELGAEFVSPEELLREADFLSLHIPLTPETHHRIGARELAVMKSSAFLVNTSRGKVVDEAALVEALRTRQIAGAALDVFENEPRLHPGFVTLPNVVLSPHLGTATAETRMAMAMLATDNLLAALDGQRPPNLVNPEVLS